MLFAFAMKEGTKKVIEEVVKRIVIVSASTMITESMKNSIKRKNSR